MNIDEAYKCPNCGKQEVNIEDIEQLFNDARSEVAVCIHCNAAWRVYYKMTDMNVKILHMPESTNTKSVDEQSPVEEVDDTIRLDEPTENYTVEDKSI